MNRTWKQSLAMIPGVGISLLPKLTCPFCWPAYAGLLSSVGLGFRISAEYLLPVTAAFLVVAVGALALRANQRHGYWPFSPLFPATNRHDEKVSCAPRHGADRCR
jgi:hypothetical protein